MVVVVESLNRVQLFASPWTRACQAPLTMEFSRQEYCKNTVPSSGDLSNPGIEPSYPAGQADTCHLGNHSTEYSFLAISFNMKEHSL